jgi:streptogramin lyase
VADRVRFFWPTVLVGLAVGVSGCGGSGHATSNQTSEASPTPVAKKTPPHLPDPFRILARYSASSLGLRNPRDLAIGPSGNLYITDATNRVSVVSPAGKLIRRWGRQGAAPGDLSFVTVDPQDPTDIAASIVVGPKGNVYLSDSGNSRVEVFSPTGTFLRKLGGYGVGGGQFVLPYDLAVDANGDVYVADENQSTVSKLAPTGKPLWRIGGPTASNSQLQGEIHLASIDPHGRLVASSDSQEAIVYVDGAGHEVDAFHTTGSFPAAQVGPCNVTVDGAGYTFVGSCGSSYTTGCGGSRTLRCVDDFEVVFDQSHRLVGAWYKSPFQLSPRFGPHGEAFTLGTDGSVLKLKVAVPGA